VNRVDASTTTLRIDAVFVDAGNTKHASRGAVESAEYAAIQEHLKAIQAQRSENQRAAQQNAERRAEMPSTKTSSVSLSKPAAADLDESWALGLTVPELEQRVAELRREVELQIKPSGAALKSAPFRGASTLASLPARSQVVVVVLSPYWYGVQTEDGHRGWIHRSELEPVD
jgi:hypothetical protein